MRKFLIPLFIFSVVWISCKDENALFEIGNDDVDVRTQMAMIDTFTVKSYTVMLDSIPTSGLSTPAIIAGTLNDDLVGTLHASSYFRFYLPSKAKANSYDIDDEAVFDSLRFFMVYNGYYQGDTTVPFTLNIYRLKDRLKPGTGGYFFNNDSVPAYSDPIGSVTFIPSPNSKDTLWITIDPALGNEFFTKMKDNQNQFLEDDLFQDYFKGVMVRGTDNNQSMLGFNYAIKAELNKVGMRLYYHYYSFTTIHKKFDFLSQLTNENFDRMMFNRFTITDPKISFPSSQRQKLPVSFTNNQSYVVSGIGILTRLEIPYLKNLNFLGDDIRVIKAELAIEPVSGTYSLKTLPDSISLNETNNFNTWGDPVYFQGEIEIAKLNIDMLYQENTRYDFNITNFVISKLGEQSDVIPAMLVHVYGHSYYRSVERIILGSQQHPENDIKLKIYYINVN